MRLSLFITVFLFLAVQVFSDKFLNPTALYWPNTILTNDPTNAPSQNSKNIRYTIIHKGADICNYMQPDYLS